MKKYLKAALTFTIFFTYSYIVILILGLFNINIKTLDKNILQILSFIIYLLVTIIIILIYKEDLKKEYKIFKDKLLDNIDTGFKYWFIGLLVMGSFNILLNFFIHTSATNEEMVQELISNYPLLMLLKAGLLVPIVEELTFRKTFKTLINNKILCILISGIIFGGLHVITSYQRPLELLYIIPYSSLGIALASMYQKTNSIYTSIFIHMIHNTILIIFSILI